MAALDIKQQLIMDVMLGALKNITVLNGYRTDIGITVSEYNGDVFGKGEDPRTMVFDVSDVNTDERAQGGYEGKITIEVHHLCSMGKDTIPYLRKMIADVNRCIGLNRELFWGSLNVTITRVKDEKGIDKEDRTIGGAIQTFEVTYSDYEFGVME
jgi:hypothetical protein